MTTFKAIAAMSQNRVIGVNNHLPWNIPDELQWFKEKTIDHIILMGRKTYESIGRPLPRRTSVVLSRSMPPTPNIHVIRNLEDITDLPLNPNQTVWIIGGSEIYNLALPYCAELYITIVKQTIPNGDAFFPDFESTFHKSDIIKETPDYRIELWQNKRPLKFKLN